MLPALRSDTEKDSDTELSIPIRKFSDVVYAQSQAKKFARCLEFSIKAQWEIAIAVSEAATNIIKFANYGVIILRELRGRKNGMEFVALDNGPGIKEIENALEGGYPEGRRKITLDNLEKRRGLGSGLPSIKRLMDVLHISAADTGGAMVVARKYR